MGHSIGQLYRVVIIRNNPGSSLSSRSREQTDRNLLDVKHHNFDILTRF